MATADSTGVLFAEAAYNNMHVHEVEDKAAHLNASLDTPVCMRLLKGDSSLKAVIWNANKAVYGLPEVGLRWKELLSKELVKYGFKPCMTDSGLIKKSDNATYVLVYVADMLVAGTLADVHQVKTQLPQSFTVKDLGVAYHFLDFLIQRDEYDIRLSHEQFTKSILMRFGYQSAHAKRPPFNERVGEACTVRCQCYSAGKYRQSFKTVAADCTCPPYDEPGINYAAFVGAAMFLATRSCPDIAS
jgi:hypothetical protein